MVRQQPKSIRLGSSPEHARLRWLVSSRSGAPPPPLCSESGAFLARTSGLDATHANAYSELICGLVSDGVWSKFDALYVFATQDSATALLNLVSSSYDLVLHGTPVFTVDRGFTGVSGSALDFIDTQFNASTAPSPQYAQNSAHLSSWSLIDAAFTGYNIGNRDTGAGSVSLLTPKQASDTQSYFHIQAGVAGFADGVLLDARGHFIGTRDSGTEIRSYHNGVFFGLSTRLATPLNNLNTYILGHNGDGTPIGNGQQQAMASIGSKLDTAPLAAAFYNRLRTYMTVVGVP